MAYIGRDIQYGTLDKQSFTANSSATVFTLDTTVKDAKSLLVSVGGVIQEPDVAYITWCYVFTVFALAIIFSLVGSWLS